MMERVECPRVASKSHDTARAYRAGCTHPEAEAAYLAARKRWNDTARRGKTVRLPSPPPLGPDPRQPWRDGTRGTKVDSNNLFLLLHGFVDRPTRAERRAAVLLLTGRPQPGDRPLTVTQVAERIGASVTTVHEILREVAHQRTTRAERRLADAQWRAALARRRDAVAEIERLRQRAAAMLTTGAERRTVETFRAARTHTCTTCGQPIAARTRYVSAGLPPGASRNRAWVYTKHHRTCLGPVSRPACTDHLTGVVA